MVILLKLLTILGTLGGVFLQSDQKWTDFQPVKAIKLELSDSQQPSIWTILGELDYEQAGAMTTHLKKSLLEFQSKYSYVLAKGEHVISKHNAAGVSFDDPYEFPYGSSLALLSYSLGILLEGFRPAVIYHPMIESLKGKDRNNPILQRQKQKSLFDLLTTLPSFDGSQSVEDSKEIVNGLDSYGREAMTYVNTILGKSKNEAWLDSFYALGIEEAPLTSSDQLKIKLHRLLSYSLAVIHEFKVSPSAPRIAGLPTVDRHYMFGWWVNCPNSLGSCLCSQLPEDLIVSVTPTLRIYIVPSLELSLIVHTTQKADVRSLREMLGEDKSVWSEMRTFLENLGGTSDRFQEVKQGSPVNSEAKSSNALPENENDSVEKVAKDSDDATIRFIHHVWPVLVFVFWVVSSHVWVYWMLHCCWILATYASKRTHIPRPKSGSAN